MRRLGTLFQIEAAIKNPAPAYVIPCASITNLPTSTAAEPITPNRNGPYPRRCRALNTKATVPAARNIRETGNKYAVEGMNGSPKAARSPA